MTASVDYADVPGTDEVYEVFLSKPDKDDPWIAFGSGLGKGEKNRNLKL